MPSSYTIGGHFENFIKEQVEGGSYASASEVIRDGLRLLEEDQKRRQAVIDGLRGEIEKGRRSGKPKPAAEVLDRLERKYTKLTKDRAKWMRAHFTPQAEIDLEEVGDYIALDNPGRAVSFIREIRQHCEKIAGGPDHYAARPDLGDTIRICAHGNYLIVFEPFEIRYPGLAKGPVEAGAGMDGLARDAARCRWPAGMPHATSQISNCSPRVIPAFKR
jgi:putative addiction module CopG family antidote